MITLAGLLICTFIITVTIIASSAQTKDTPDWVYNFAFIYAIITSIFILTIIILSIIFFACLCKNKQVNSLYLAACIITWAFALCIFIVNILTAAKVELNDTVRSVLGWFDIAFLITMVVLDSISYSRLNKQYKEEKK